MLKKKKKQTYLFPPLILTPNIFKPPISFFNFSGQSWIIERGLMRGLMTVKATLPLAYLDLTVASDKTTPILLDILLLYKI
jgi:hypothetical protein